MPPADGRTVHQPFCTRRAIHRNPELYANPDEFQPERYLKYRLSAAEYINIADPYQRDHYTYGASRRICPGVHVAERSLYIDIARTLWGLSIWKNIGADGKIIEPTTSMNSPISDVLNRHIRHHHPEVEMMDGAGRARKLIEGNGTRVRSGTQSPRAGFPSSRADSPSARLAAVPSPTPPVSPPSPLPDVMVHDWELPHLDGSTGMDASCLEGLQRYLDECPDLQPNSARAISGPTIASMPTPMLGTFDRMIDPSLGASAPAQAADSHVVNHQLSEEIDFQSILVGSPDMADINPSLPPFHHLCSKNGISNEQFERVRRLWPRRRRTGPTIPALFSWDEIVRHPEDNILSSPALETPPDPADSFWGLTDACRDRLVEDTRGYGAISSPDRGDGGSSSAGSSSCGPWNGELPPTDILDLCLDLYFSHFQVHLPFVHPGTFNASLTPSIFLFPMCLVGLILLNKTTARGLIATHIPGPGAPLNTVEP
ncbi:uncharacterized protein BO88DRAFT_486863, partial [Aspergillus vadensis CBS 113365]